MLIFIICSRDLRSELDLKFHNGVTNGNHSEFCGTYRMPRFPPNRKYYEAASPRDSRPLHYESYQKCQQR